LPSGLAPRVNLAGISTYIKLSGPDAPDDMRKAPVTQAWLSVSDDKLAQSTGAYFYHQKLREPNAAARDAKVQDALLVICGRLSRVRLS
jgi:hypothetical protein